uniref:Synergin gamma n=1 Tax=Paramormyrops kingsleyae TaxID=1676925 RepID=A0A3B3RYC6_9TELE
MYPVGGGLGPPQGLIPLQQQQGFPMVQVMQPNMQGMMGMNFGAQMPPGAMPIQGTMPMAMQAQGMPFMGQPPFMGMRAPGPQFSADVQKQMAEEHQKRLEQQARLLEEDRKRRQFEEQKQKLRLLSSVKPKTGERSRDDALEAIKGNLDGFSRDAKMHPTPSTHPNKPAHGQSTDPAPSWPRPLVAPPPSWPRPLVAPPEAVTLPSATFAGVAVFPQQEHMQPMLPAWLYNDSLVPELFKKVLEFSMTPSGVDTAKLYPILMSSGLPREALGQIWATANRTTPGKLTKEELYSVLAMIGVAQSGLPVMGLDVLSQFPSPPVPSLPALPPVAMAVTAAQPPASFVASFPPAQGGKPDDDDFQEFQEAPKAGAAEDSFTDFQGESGAPATSVTPSQNVPPTYSVFRELEPPSDRKPVGEGFADFKSASADDGFTDFKTADSISPLDPSDSAKMVQPTFSPAFPKSHPLQPQLPAPLSQPRNPLNMADLDLFSSLAPPGPPADGKLPSFPSPGAAPSVAVAPPPSTGSKPSGGGVDDFGDFALFGSSSGAGSVAQDDFADFMAFGSAGEAWGDTRPGASSLGERQSQRQQPPQHRGAPDKYDVFKQLSLEGGLAYDDAKEGSGSLASLRGDADDFADFQSSKFCTALGASEKSLTDKLAKEDSSSVKSLDLPSIGGSSAGKDDSEDALSVQLDMKLSDVGGDLKHVMSDSSLDLPGLSAHQPPSAGEELVPLPSLKRSQGLLSCGLKRLRPCLCIAGHRLPAPSSHKRSHSLGDKEISRSTPSPAPETPFRDRSNTLSEKPALPVIRDKYKDLTGEVEESERYAYEWQRCLESALQVISKANDTLNNISSSAVCTEVIQSEQGMDYLLGVVEVYRVTKRVELGIKATAVCSEKLQNLLKDISRVWNNLMGFMSLASLTPDESSLDFSSCILRHGIRNAKELACGVCLLNVDSRSKAFNSETDNFKLLYGGHQYHASCANFWINCVEPKPPGLVLPDLL